MLDEGTEWDGGVDQNRGTAKFRHRQSKVDASAGGGNSVVWEDEKDQEGLTWFIRSLDIYRGVMHHAINIWRKHEVGGPWEEHTHFWRLENRFDKLKRALPVHLRLDPQGRGIGYHLAMRSIRVYVQLHSVLALCDISLHREYLPFLPINCSKPSGPLDGPPLPPLPLEHLNYWEQSAIKCFKAAKEFLDLTWACKEKGELSETPITGFAMFFVVCTSAWCDIFPNMDEQEILCERPDRSAANGNYRNAIEILTSMSKRLQMATFWVTWVNDYSLLLKKLKKEHPGLAASPTSNDSSSTDRTNRDLMEWLKIKKIMTEMNPIDGSDPALPKKAAQSTSHGSVDGEGKASRSTPYGSEDTNDIRGSQAVKSEAAEKNDPSMRTSPSLGFTAINNPKGVSDHGTSRVVDRAQRTSSTSEQHHYEQPSLDAMSDGSQLLSPSFGFQNPSAGLPAPSYPCNAHTSMVHSTPTVPGGWNFAYNTPTFPTDDMFYSFGTGNEPSMQPPPLLPLEEFPGPFQAFWPFPQSSSPNTNGKPIQPMSGPPNDSI